MSRRVLIGATALLLALGGCADETFVWVNVAARPAVRGLTRLEITVAAGGDQLLKTFGDGVVPLPLPSSFTVTPGGHRGKLVIAGAGKDVDGRLVATGTATVEVVEGGRAEATLLLEPADFQVNSLYVAGDQSVTDFDGRAGRQAAAAGDGSFIVVYENLGNLGRFDGLGRLFAGDGTPRENAVGLNKEDFILNEWGSENVFYLAVAAAPGGAFLATWRDYDLETLNARRFAADGTPASEVTLSTGTVPLGAGAAAGCADGGFVVVWSQERSVADPTHEIRARLVGPDGRPRKNDTTGDDLDFPVGAPTSHEMRRPAVAVGANGDAVVAWLDQPDLYSAGTIHVQRFGPSGLAGAPDVLVAAPTSGYPEAPNLAACPDGFLVVYTDRPGTSPDDDVFALFLDPSASAWQAPYRVNTATDGDQEEPAAAVAPDGATLIVWTDLASRPEDGDGSIRARALAPSGLPVGVDFAVNTTTAERQSKASVAVAAGGAFVVAWEDASGAGPDTDGTGVRARLVYPSFAPDDGTSGARCGDGRACHDGLTCTPRADGSYCHPACDAALVGQPCAGGSTGRSAAESGAPTAVCLFR